MPQPVRNLASAAGVAQILLAVDGEDGAFVAAGVLWYNLMVTAISAAPPNLKRNTPSTGTKKEELIMPKHRHEVRSGQDRMPSRFSYPKKAITLTAAANVQGYKKFSGKLQRRMIHSAAELVGIVPFDWFREKDIFIMFFGLDTFESALAVRTKLVKEGYLVSIWNSEEEMDMASAALRQLDAAGHEVGPITDSDGNELDFDWRNTPKTN